MPSLLELSAELKLTIIEYLDLDEQLENEEKSKRKEDEEDDEEEENDEKDGVEDKALVIARSWPVLSLSSTCKVFRLLCAPFVFNSLVLVNKEKSAASIQSIANGPNAHLVRNFRFSAKTEPMMGASYDKDQAPKDKDFPGPVRNLLENLKAFSKLEHLAVRLPGHRDHFEMYPDDETEDWEVTLEAENNEIWRGLTRDAYNAIAKNHDHESLKHLELLHLVGKQVSSWDDDNFKQLLGKLDGFKISLMGGDNGAGWCMNTNEWYGEFMKGTSGFFFEHLTNVTHFSLVATTDGPVGLEGWRHAPVPLSASLMPKLRSLHLKHNFISSQLSQFISGHSKVLERIHLEDCYSGLNCSLAENGISWAHFLEAIARADPLALVSFQVTPIHYNYDERVYGDSTEARYRKVKNELTANPERHLFAYNELDDKYGMLFEDGWGTVDAFGAGADQAAFDKLMVVVASNASRIGGE